MDIQNCVISSESNAKFDSDDLISFEYYNLKLKFNL